MRYLFTTGGILSEGVAAAETLAGEGIEVRIVDVHTIKPLDLDGVLEAARECGHVITLEEHVVTGGLGSAVAETCADAGLALKSFHRIGVGDVFPDVVGDQSYLRAHFGLDAASVASVIRQAIVR